MMNIAPDLNRLQKNPGVRHAGMRGVAAIEFALLLPFMILMIFGISEYGRAMFEYNTLMKGARNSARYLSQFSSADAAYPIAGARCLAVHGNLDCTGPTLVPGLTEAMIIVCDSTSSTDCPGGNYANVTTGSGSINLVEVKISGYVFNSMVPFITNAATISFADIRTTMRQI